MDIFLDITSLVAGSMSVLNLHHFTYPGWISAMETGILSLLNAKDNSAVCLLGIGQEPGTGAAFSAPGHWLGGATCP